jgi:phage portal protein BeeE
VKPLTRLRHALKAFTASWATSSPWPEWPTNRAYDTTPAPGEPWKNGAVNVAVVWAMRNFVLAELAVEEKGPDGWVKAVEHPLYTALDSNPYFDSDDLWQATVLCLMTKGRAYWLKAVDQLGRPAHFYPIWPWQVSPKRADGKKFLTHYEYQPGDGRKFDLLPEELIHFRFGLDPENEMEGYDPYRALQRDIATDNEQGEYTWDVLKNAGVSCGIISPGNPETVWTPEQTDAIKMGMTARTSGRLRGSWAAFDRQVAMAGVGATPQQMTLETLGNREEARLAAAASVPAMVTGLLVGQHLKSYANMKEAREQGWEECLMPIGRTAGRALRRQLPEIIDRARQRVVWDYSNISALQEDQNALYQRVSMLWEKELADRAEVRGLLKLEVDEARDRGVFYGAMKQERAMEIAQQTQPQEAESIGDRAAAMNGKSLAEKAAALGIPGCVRNRGLQEPGFCGKCRECKALAMPERVVITRSDLEEAEALFDSALPEFAGLLSAEPVTNGNGTARP